MEEWLSKQEIEEKYHHISRHSFPFECVVVKVIPQKGHPFSERWDFLSNLFFITDDEFFFQYTDICKGDISTNQDGQPFDILLDGVLRYVYSFAYTSSSERITGYLLALLSEGKIFGGKDKNNKPYYLVCDYWYSYLPQNSHNKELEQKFFFSDESPKKKKYWSLPIVNNKEIIDNGSLKDYLLIPIKKEDIAKVNDFYDNYMIIKNSLGYYQLYNKNENVLSGIYFNEIIYGDYIFDYSSGSSEGIYDFIIRRDDKWGCLDKDGNLIIPCEYDKITHFIYAGHPDSGLYNIWKDNNVGLCTDEGKVLINCCCKNIYHIGYFSPIFIKESASGYCYIDYLEKGEMQPVTSSRRVYEEFVFLNEDSINDYLYLAAKSKCKYAIIKIYFGDNCANWKRQDRITNFEFGNIEECKIYLKQIGIQ